MDLHYRDPIDLVWRVKHQTDALKLSPEPFVSRRFLQFAIQLLPRFIVLDLLFDTYAQVPPHPPPRLCRGVVSRKTASCLPKEQRRRITPVISRTKGSIVHPFIFADTPSLR
jgi:hypothetical protein